jgi:DUF1680 family protein
MVNIRLSAVVGDGAGVCRFRHLAGIAFCCAIALLFAASLVFGAPAPTKVDAFDMSAVSLLPGVCQSEQLADKAYLLRLKSDSLLYNFRHQAGVAAPGTPCGGWEAPDCELRGHFVGHYLSALSLMYKSTGDPELKAHDTLMVSELAKCQRADGYLSAFPDSFFDRVEAGKNVWAPYYTVHKIMAGLLDSYTYCGNKQALGMAERMASYFKGRCDKLSDDQMKIVMRNEFGGMANVLYDIYAVDHNPDFLALAHRFDQQSFLAPLMAGNDDLTGIHGNTHIPKILGAARRYELLGDAPYKTAVVNFWNDVALHRSYATGGSTVGEGWRAPDKLSATLVSNNQETCTSYNILKVTRDLFRWTADPKYADFYEKVYWNGIVEAQNPATGMMIYYTPLEFGGKKNWGTEMDAFWCCYGTGVESFAKLNDSIYFHDANSAYVNLYVPSKLNWQSKGVTITQQTKFPVEQAAHFTVSLAKPTRFALHLHVPYWVSGAQGYVVAINGKRDSQVAKLSTYYTIDRTWKNGDKIDVSLPMALHASPMPDNPSIEAAMYGPLTLCGLVDDQTPRSPDVKTTGLINAPTMDVSSWLEPVAGKPLTFQTKGQDHPVMFIPLYKVIDQRYASYWTVVTPNSALKQKLSDIVKEQGRELANYTDAVHPNDSTSEQAHNLQQQASNSGQVNDFDWRDAQGWFSWDLKIAPNAPVTLSVGFWGPDSNRTFDILVDGQKIATQTLTGGKPANVYWVDYAVPQDLTKDKTQITVKFQAAPGSTAGGVFGVRTSKPTVAPATL